MEKSPCQFSNSCTRAHGENPTTLAGRHKSRIPALVQVQDLYLVILEVPLHQVTLHPVYNLRQYLVRVPRVRADARNANRRGLPVLVVSHLRSRYMELVGDPGEQTT